MNYPAWRPTDNTHIIPTPSTRIQALVHIQAQAQGTPGQAMRPTLWQTPQACLQLRELEEDPRTVIASKRSLATQAVVEGMGVEMGAQHHRRQRNPTEEAKCPHQTTVSTSKVLGVIVATWALGIIQPSI